MTTIIVPETIRFGPFKVKIDPLALSDEKGTRRLILEMLHIFNEIYLSGELEEETINRIVDGIMKSWRLFDIKLELTC